MRRLDEEPIIESTDNPAANSHHPTESPVLSPQVNYLDRESALNASKGLRTIVITTLIFSLVVTFALIIQIWVGPNQVPPRIGIITPEQECSEIGAQMIRKNGNSADAFIASALCLSVVNPFAAGFGAGGFLVARDHKYNKNLALNCWFKSGSIDISMLQSPSFIAMPGELKCLQYIYHRYSRLWWPTLTAPAAKLARSGFRTSKQLARALRQVNLNSELTRRFLNKDGKLAEEGDIIYNLRLASALENFDKDENNLYDGGFLSKDLTKNALSFTLGDLKNYSSIEMPMTLATFNDFNILTTQYPSNGPILRFILNLMSKFDTNADNLMNSLFYHRFIEAVKLGYKAQSNIADSKEAMKVLDYKLKEISEDFLGLIDGNKTIDRVSLDEYALNDHLHVNYISVNDHNDLMIAYVGTLGSLWGSQVVTDAGYVLNDGLSLFELNKSVEFNQANHFEKHKQPRGLLSPIITYHNKNPCMRRLVVAYAQDKALDYGLSAQVQVLMKILTDLKYFPSAIDDKRVEHRQTGICFEDGFDLNLKHELLQIYEQSSNSNQTCLYDALNLVMKKDPIISLAIDSQRSIVPDTNVVFNS